MHIKEIQHLYKYTETPLYLQYLFTLLENA